MSKIEWTEKTWNPVTGCTKVSPGCKHCYAETMAKRLQAMGAVGYENGFRLMVVPDRIEQPIKRKKPTIYFVNSMSDLFQKGLPMYFIHQIISVIRITPRHTYQILTKRSNSMLQYFTFNSVPKNAWLGVSVENKKHGLPRIDDLRKITATVRFLSIEPLLEDLGEIDLTGIHWVIVGGESGRNARPMQQAWVENIQRQCKQAAVPFFFKQWGAFGSDGKARSKKNNGRILNGCTWDDLPTTNQQSLQVNTNE